MALTGRDDDRCADRGADLDGSGGLEELDIAAFFDAFELGNPAADFDCSGSVDDLDITAFFDAFEDGDIGTHDLDRARFFFKGYWWDPHIRKYFVRHRVYDPLTFRWMQRDPLGLAAGPNLYDYCGGNPVDFYDPYGLDAWWVGDAFRYIGLTEVGEWADDTADGAIDAAGYLFGDNAAEDAKWEQEAQNTASRQWSKSLEQGNTQQAQDIIRRNHADLNYVRQQNEVRLDLSIASAELAASAIPTGYVAKWVATSVFRRAATKAITRATDVAANTCAADAAAAAGSRTRIAIGETMTRVRQAASRYAAETFELSPSQEKWLVYVRVIFGDKAAKELLKKWNAEWAERAASRGADIIDAGIDNSRPIRSEFYQIENAIFEAGDAVRIDVHVPHAIP